MDESSVMIRERITALESLYNALHKRVDRIEELVECVQKMTVEMQHMREDINNVASQISELESKPAKRWDAVISAILGAFAGGIGTMIVTVILGG